MTNYSSESDRPEAVGGAAGSYEGATESTGGGSATSGGLSGVTSPPTYVPSTASSTTPSSTTPSSTTPSTSGSGSGGGSRSEVAKSEASEVKDAAVSAGSEVAGTAKQEAASVVQEAGAQARGLLDQLRSDLREQGAGQKDRVASTLHSLSKELGSMASRSEEDGPVTDLAHQASRKGGEVAHWLESHDPADVLAEVKRYARRRPFAFLAMCAAAGVVVGRLTRGAVAANTSLDSPDSDAGRVGSSYADRSTEQYAVAPSSYTTTGGTYATTGGTYTPSATTDPAPPSTGVLNGPGDAFEAGGQLASDRSGLDSGEFRR